MSLRRPTLTLDTADPAFVREPWPRYEDIRNIGGVSYNEQVSRWMVSDFDVVKHILTSPERFGSERGQVEQAALFGGPTMEFYDRPHHDGIRGIWSAWERANDVGAAGGCDVGCVGHSGGVVLARHRGSYPVDCG